MKNLLFGCILIPVLNANAQSVDRNDIVLAVSPGATLNYYGGNDSTGPFHTGSDYFGLRAPVSLEYVFSRTFGISADFVYSRMNAGTIHTSNFTVADFGLGLRFHSPSNKRIIDWFGEVGFHYSKLHYFFHGDLAHETTDAKGWSLFYEVGANIPLSASEKFGMGLSLNGSAYKYPAAHFEGNFGGSSDFKMNGIALATGINFYYKL
jgi:hypothetical protein